MADSSNLREGSSGQAAENHTAVTSAAAAASDAGTNAPYPLPRVTIRFCTQCKWMLRAAYFAQELLSTFSMALGEVALQPSTGGTFVVELLFQDPSPSPSSDTPAAAPVAIQRRVLWDRKVDGGFPETKELKRRVRDAIEPGRNLGHVDRDYGNGKQQQQQQQVQADTTSAATAPASDATIAGIAQPQGTRADGEVCEDCR
ncbi:hypothetical protein SLS62_007079 [Diatrype stigma]|uniref:Uncharacterized protein n=1 Tax=Diatrype stigma TaxID=117547 RepID=A0AAN9UPT9_9PEZI